MNIRLLFLCIASASLAMFSALAIVNDELDPSIGWIIVDDTNRIAEERLTTEQEAAGVKPWKLKLGGNWNSTSLDSVNQVGDNTTLDLSKKFYRPYNSTVIKISSGVKGKVFQNKTTIRKVLLTEESGYLGFSSTGAQFDGCTGIEEVSPFLPAWMNEVPGSMFSGCSALEGDLVLPNHTFVGTYSFSGTKVGSLTIGNPDIGLISIGKQAFKSDTALTNVTILGKSGWQTITTTSGTGDNFDGCTSLKNFTMMSFPTAMQTTAFKTHAAKSNYAGTYKYKICFFVPRDIVDEQGLLIDGITPWDELDAETKNTFKTRWADMGAKRALGVINDTQSSGASYHYGTYALPANQFIAYIPDAKKGLTVLIR